jgi:hypothetical protein
MSGNIGGLSHSEEHDLIWEYSSQDESEFIFDEIFTKQVYLKHGITINEGSTVVDVGANIGLYSLFCVKQTKCLNLLCIEPIPPNFNILKRNLSSFTKKKGHVMSLLMCAVGSNVDVLPANFYFFPGEF